MVVTGNSCDDTAVKPLLFNHVYHVAILTSIMVITIEEGFCFCLPHKPVTPRKAFLVSSEQSASTRHSAKWTSSVSVQKYMFANLERNYVSIRSR